MRLERGGPVLYHLGMKRTNMPCVPGALKAVALLAPVLIAGVASAQQRDLPISPAIRDFANPPILLSFFLLIVVVAAAIGPNLMPSKRGHQD